MIYDLEDKVVIITGAARGVGRAMVAAFVAQKANVIASDRDAVGLAETCHTLPQVLQLIADVSAPDGVQAIVDASVQGFARLDVCVNNAAVAPHTALLDETADVWDKVYAGNCRGTFLMTQAHPGRVLGALYINRHLSSRSLCESPVVGWRATDFEILLDGARVDSKRDSAIAVMHRQPTIFSMRHSATANSLSFVKLVHAYRLA